MSLNPTAKQFTTAKQHLKMETETETPDQNERSQIQEEKESAQDESQAQETILGIMQLDLETNVQGSESKI